MPKKEVSPPSSARTALKKIKKLRREEINFNSVVKLNEIVRKYLQKKFRLKLSLTAEELLAHLENKRIKKAIKLDLNHLIVQIYKLEYHHKGPPTISEFDQISRLAFRTIKEVEINQKIKEEKPKRDKKKVKNAKGEKVSKEYVKLKEILGSLGENFHNDWSNQEIREKYEKIRRFYSQMPKEEKLEAYPIIKALFELNKLENQMKKTKNKKK